MTDHRVPFASDIARIDRGTPFEFTFEGHAVIAYPGETVGAALTAAGIETFRLTRRYGRPRGLFCGIGICFDCLLVVNGSANQRACVTLAQPGIIVRMQRGAGDVPVED